MKGRGVGAGTVWVEKLSEYLLEPPPITDVATENHVRFVSRHIGNERLSELCAHGKQCRELVHLHGDDYQ